MNIQHTTYNIHTICVEVRLQYRTHVLTISYIDLVIFAHVAQARVGEENFQYICTGYCTVSYLCICMI
jgi:hypothetical protein